MYFDAATFQVTYQLKIVTTAVLMYYLMRKDLSVRQWISVIVLTCGKCTSSKINLQILVR